MSAKAAPDTRYSGRLLSSATREVVKVLTMSDPDTPAELARKVRALAANTKSPDVRAALNQLAEESEAIASQSTEDQPAIPLPPTPVPHAK
jgi:ABC-type hemin transport system substrate-binding protein